MKTIFIAILVLWTTLCSYKAWAEDTEVSPGGVRVNGVLYNIADDRQVVKVGGVYQPEEIDFYVKRRFDRLEALMADLKASQERLLDRIEHLEAEEKNGT